MAQKTKGLKSTVDQVLCCHAADSEMIVRDLWSAEIAQLFVEINDRYLSVCKELPYLRGGNSGDDAITLPCRDPSRCGVVDGPVCEEDRPWPILADVLSDAAEESSSEGGRCFDDQCDPRRVSYRRQAQRSLAGARFLILRHEIEASPEIILQKR
jgi:hypothetical protein